jgi:hypothetical protein
VKASNDCQYAPGPGVWAQLRWSQVPTSPFISMARNRASRNCRNHAEHSGFAGHGSVSVGSDDGVSSRLRMSEVGQRQEQVGAAAQRVGPIQVPLITQWHGADGQNMEDRCGSCFRRLSLRRYKIVRRLANLDRDLYWTAIRISTGDHLGGGEDGADTIRCKPHDRIVAYGLLRCEGMLVFSRADPAHPKRSGRHVFL